MKKLIILLLLVATPLMAQWSGEGKAQTVFNAVSFEEAVASTDTSETINLLDFPKVDYAFSVAGADSLRWAFYIDKSVGGNWINSVVSDSLAYGGTTGVSDLVPATGGLIRTWATDHAIGTEFIRFRVVRTEVDSTSATTYTLTINGKR